MSYHGTGSGLLLKSLLTIKVTGQNVDKPKRRQPKRRQTKPRQTETSTDRNVDRPNRRHTETSTNQNVERPKRRRTKMSTNLNVDTPFHYWLRLRRSPFNFGLKVRSSLTLRMGVYWIYRLLECLIKSCNKYLIYLFVIVGVENRMVNMLLFETKLPLASSCRSTWPHCNTVYCRWGRYDTTDITKINALSGRQI